jgi:hypothetical protein
VSADKPVRKKPILKPIVIPDHRGVVVQRIFQDDLITELSAADDKLIQEYYGSGDDSGIKVMPTERAFHIGNVKPCSPAVRDRLDRAVGRYIRMNAQRVTAEEWLKRAPFDVKSNRRAILKALDSIDKPPPFSGPGPGRRSRIKSRVEGEVREELKTGKLTLGELADMTLKDFSERFDCKLNMASEVRRAILRDPNLKK